MKSIFCSETTRRKEFSVCKGTEQKAFFLRQLQLAFSRVCQPFELITRAVVLQKTIAQRYQSENFCGFMLEQRNSSLDSTAFLENSNESLGWKRRFKVMTCTGNFARIVNKLSEVDNNCSRSEIAAKQIFNSDKLSRRHTKAQ